MDPITTAIAAALAAGVVSGATKVGKKVIVDAYDALKSAIKKKYGADSDLAESIKSFEKKPDSAGRKATLQEEVTAAKAEDDADLVKLAQSVLDKLSALPGGEQHIQQATGKYIAQADRGGTATVTVTQPKE